MPGLVAHNASANLHAGHVDYGRSRIWSEPWLELCASPHFTACCEPETCTRQRCCCRPRQLCSALQRLCTGPPPILADAHRSRAASSRDATVARCWSWHLRTVGSPKLPYARTTPHLGINGLIMSSAQSRELVVWSSEHASSAWSSVTAIHERVRLIVRPVAVCF